MSSDSERNRLGGRLMRYAQVTGAIGGAAARFAGQKVMGSAPDTAGDAARFKELLGGLKGPLMKVGQMLATIPDAVPAEYAAELGQLQADAPSMGWPFVRRRMAGELGPDWRQRFAEFGQTAAAAASLGQVHKAVGLDGRILACKLQYPDMASTVEADLNQLKMALAVFQRLDGTISTRQIQEELAARLREELDYAQEARHLSLYGDMLAQVEGVQVPALVPGLSTPRLLTMTWLEGDKLLPFAQSHPDTGTTLALHLFRAWYVPFYHYGVIHGDPHLGNYTVQPDLTLNLLDFGCIRIFPPSFVKGVIDLYNALLHDDEELAVAAYESWGFANLSRELIEVLNIWARFIYGPLMEDRTRLIQLAPSARYGRETAMRVHVELRKVGGIAVPREFVFMDRAAIGLGSVFLHLKAEINWYRLFQDLITNFDVDLLATRQLETLFRHGLSPPPPRTENT